MKIQYLETNEQSAKKRGKYQNITIEQRKNFIQRTLQDGLTMKAAAELENINYKSAFVILKQYKKYGRIGKKQTREKKKKIFKKSLFHRKEILIQQQNQSQYFSAADATAAAHSQDSTNLFPNLNLSHLSQNNLSLNKVAQQQQLTNYQVGYSEIPSQQEKQTIEKNNNIVLEAKNIKQESDNEKIQSFYILPINSLIQTEQSQYQNAQQLNQRLPITSIQDLTNNNNVKNNQKYSQSSLQYTCANQFGSQQYFNLLYYNYLKDQQNKLFQ